MAEKTIAYVILAVVAITAIVGLILLFNSAGKVTGNVAGGSLTNTGAYSYDNGAFRADSQDFVAGDRRGLGPAPVVYAEKLVAGNEASAATEQIIGGR